MDLSAIRIKVQADTKEAEGSLAKLKKTGDSLASVGKSLTLGLTTPIVALGTASLMAASNAGEMESKFNTVFKNLASEADSWANTYADAIGRSKYEIKEAISNQADLYQGMGFTADEAFELSKQVTTLGYDLASFNNVNDADAVNAMTKALMGETESAKMLGVNLTDTVMETSEFVKATGKSWKEMTMAEKANARYQEAMKQSKNAIGDAEKTSGSFANMTKRVKGQLHELSVEIGKVILPVAEKLITVFSGMLDKVMSFIQENPKLAQTIVVIAGALAALGPTIFIVGKLITLFATFPVVMGVVAGAVLAAGLAWLGFNEKAQETLANLPTIIGDAITKFMDKIVEMLPMILQKGIDLVMWLIQGIGQAIPLLLQFATDMLLMLMEKFIEYFPQLVQMGWNFILNLIDGLKQALPQFIDNVGQGIVNAINTIKEKLPEFLAKGIEMIKNLAKGFKDNFPEMISKVFELMGDVINKIMEWIPKIIKAGWDLIKSLVKGLWDNRGEIWTAIKDIGSGILSAFGEAIKGVVNIGKNIVENLKAGISSAWSSFTGWVSGKLQSIPIIGKFFSLTPPEDDGMSTAPEASMFGAKANPLGRAGGLLNMLESPDLFGGSSRASIQSGASASNPFAALEAAIERLSNSKMAGAVETVINIDGREFARTTTPYISRELAWGTR